MTITVRALSTSMIGIPAMGRLGVGPGKWIDYVVRADDDSHVHRLHCRVYVVHFLHT